MKRKINAKVFLCYVAILMSIIYIIWRILYTIPSIYDVGIMDFICAILLLFAEIIGIISGIGVLSGCGKDYNPEMPDISIIPKDWYPHVDVFIATHNEPKDLLFKTINGCLNMEYPDKNKVHIYICDDGNREEIKDLAAKMKVGYLGLPDNKAAKAGNLNNAISKTNSPLIVTFDADMIPKNTFLMKTVPYFFLSKSIKDKDGNWVDKEEDKDLKIGFIQTPQNFYNPDLFQYNLFLENCVPNEQTYFFKEVNVLKNKNNTPIYAGSNTVISREALNSIGGICEGILTEDFATGALIQAKGYRCYAIREVLANGLSPDDLSSLIKQRERWSRGVVQTFRKLSLCFMKGLTLSQKFSYLMCLLYWYTPFARLMYIIAPILFLLFDITVVKSSLFNVMCIWLPYYVVFLLAVKTISTGIRKISLSNLYDTIMCSYLVLPMIFETLGIKKKNFLVTRKDRIKIEKSNMGYLVFPLVLFILNLLALVRGLIISINSNSIEYLVGIYWTLVNFYYLLMALFFVKGRRMYRMSERFKIEVPITLFLENNTINTYTLDICENGFSIFLDNPKYIEDDEFISVNCSTDRYNAFFNCKIVQVNKVNNRWKYSFKICEIDSNNKKEYYNIIYDRDYLVLESINKNINPIIIIKDNIKNRLAKRKNSNRKLPRVYCNKMIKIKKEIQMKISNFNYKYILLECENWDKISYDILEVNLDEGILIECKYTDRISNKKRLFKVLNYKELAFDQQFQEILFKWDKAQEI